LMKAVTKKGNDSSFWHCPWKRKNRASKPEDGRKTRGIQNEHNVGLRRTRALVCTQDRAEILKIQRSSCQLLSL
jgi:hypothetical protein